MTSATIYPHAITDSGRECTFHEVALEQLSVVAVRDSYDDEDKDLHPPTAADLALIQAEEDECSE